MKLPSVVAHADWSLGPQKRWFASARLARGVYLVSGPERVGDAASFLRRLSGEADGRGSVLVGFDFPIGVPLAYAKVAGIESLPHLLPQLGWGEWKDFYRVAERPDEISVRRPFYPQRPGGTSQAHLLGGLGVASMQELLRVPDRRTADRNQACSIFWTLGGNQVGKAAISGWREVLTPALRDQGLDAGLWPFDGALEDLLETRHIVITETYPTEFYGHLGIALKGSKQWHENRAAQSTAFEAWLTRPAIDQRVSLQPGAKDAVRSGFGQDKDGEDPFDAFVGLLGMLNVVLGGRGSGWPSDSVQRLVEGWILGQSAGGVDAPPQAPLAGARPVSAFWGIDHPRDGRAASRRPSEVAAPARVCGTPAVQDDAIKLARDRYARGEISRDEFLQIRDDLSV